MPDAINPVTITAVGGKYPKIIHYSALPTKALVGSINGLLSGVLAYAGAQLFVEFMAEMRRPRDFLKVRSYLLIVRRLIDCHHRPCGAPSSSSSYATSYMDALSTS